MRTSKLKIEDIKVKSFITTNHQTRVLKTRGNDGGYTWVG